jgi:hypothetical protein
MGMFFLRRTRPIELRPEFVRALRPSLNTPVVATADLPPGPACGAILVHVEPGHGLQISVGVRSLASGAVALYGFDGPICAAVVGTALDAALSFAEGMGFLFDDDLLGDEEDSREKEVLRWQELIGEGGVAADAAEASGSEPDALFEADGGELTDPPASAESAAAPETLFELPESEAPVAAQFRESPAEDRAPLTKFRHPVAAAAALAAAPDEVTEPVLVAPKKRALGRLRLVKRHADSRGQEAERSWLLRLLGSF